MVMPLSDAQFPKCSALGTGQRKHSKERRDEEEAGKTRTSGNKRGDNPDGKYGKRNKGVSMVTLIFRDEALRAHFVRTFSQNGSRGQGGWLGRQMYSHSKV